MRATITSTDQIVEIKDMRGMPCAVRVWEGVTAAGVPFTAYVAMVRVSQEQDNSEFARELIDLRMIL